MNKLNEVAKRKELERGRIAELRKQKYIEQGYQKAKAEILAELKGLEKSTVSNIFDNGKGYKEVFLSSDIQNIIERLDK